MEDAKIQLTVREVTGETTTDGFHISTDQMSVANESGTAFLRQYERRSIRTLTAFDDNGALGERIRITSVGDPLVTYGGLNSNLTRVGISSMGSNPVTRPRSVLHIGENLPTTVNHGGRNWMNVGTLNVENSRQAYFGLKDAATTTPSATICWGAAGYPGTPAFNMPLTFNFTSDGIGSMDYNALNGREIARMNPNGHVGIGNINPQNALEIESKSGDPYWTVTNNFPGLQGSTGLRFSRMRSTNLAVENPGEGVLSVDANGDVIYVADGSCEWNEDGQDLYMGMTGLCHEGNVGIGVRCSSIIITCTRKI